MAEDASNARRVRVERNIYRRPSGVYEVGFKDGGGKQRWRTVAGGITAARALRDELLARRGRGEQVVTDGRTRFVEAAAKWLDGPVLDLRPRTQECYRNAVEQQLLPSFGTRRLDAISPDNLALLVRELRSRGFSESTIVIVLGVTNRVYRYAARRLGWTGTNPVSLMLPSERPKPSHGKRRRIFEGRELEQTIRAAGEPYRMLFTVAALTGARLSELLALTWADARLDDLDDAELEFGYQVDRHGERQATQTDGSARTVPIPKELALMLAHHKLGSRFAKSTDFVFCTRTGRPLGQRNVTRSLREAQRKATDEGGHPTFPVLHERDDQGRRARVGHGELPSMHSFRHTVASRALLAGESVDEIAFLLGHRDANVTRAVYVRELADTRRRSMRRSRMLAEYADLLKQ
jgi:integrase